MKLNWKRAELDIVLDVDVVKFNYRPIATGPMQCEKRG